MHRLKFLLIFVTATGLFAADEAPKEPERLRLFIRDQVKVSVQGEADVSVERQIDGAGEINLPLLGSIKIAGLTIAEAQQLIMDRYVRDEIFVHPEIVLTVTAYAPKEVTLLGQVAKQGKLVFPADTTSLSLVEAIASVGGLTRIANGGSVRITRRDAQGAEQTVTVNVDKMIEGRGSSRETFILQPGDIIFVPERVF